MYFIYRSKLAKPVYSDSSLDAVVKLENNSCQKKGGGDLSGPNTKKNNLCVSSIIYSYNKL